MPSDLGNVKVWVKQESKDPILVFLSQYFSKHRNNIKFTYGAAFGHEWTVCFDNENLVMLPNAVLDRNLVLCLFQNQQQANKHSHFERVVLGVLFQTFSKSLVFCQLRFS